MFTDYCTHCSRNGHTIRECRELVKLFDLPATIGAVCSVCNAKGRHYSGHCPKVTGRPLRSMVLRGPTVTCGFCQKQGHGVPICWAFARRHNLPAPFWWRCKTCAAVGEHGAEACGSFAAYAQGDYGRVVLLDMQLTRADENAEIVSIGACSVGSPSETCLFHHYIRPEGEIETYATARHGLTKSRGLLRLMGDPVQATSTKYALEDFFKWLEETVCSFVVLAIYDTNNLKMNTLLRHLKFNVTEGLLHKLTSSVVFADARPFVESALGKSSLVEVGDAYQAVFNTRHLGEHQALVDVAALRDVLLSDPVRTANFVPFVYDPKNAVKMLGYD